jgi:RHS repeat-associated protein
LKHGTPNYGAEDFFVFGGQELYAVALTASGLEYRTRRDNFMRVLRQSGNTWTVTQRDGTRLRFGTSANSRIEGPLGTFEWLLESVIDTNGNAYAVTYDRSDPGTAYPQLIRYTLRDSGTGALESLDGNPSKDRRLDFVLETRADASESFLAGFERVITKRLARIDVSAAGDLVRRYVIRYSESPDSYRSLLSEVELQGSTGSASPFVTRFTYATNAAEAGTTGWSEEPTWTWPNGITLVDGNQRDEGVRLGDVDGDGLPDLIKSFANTQSLPGNVTEYTRSADSGVYLNDGGGWSSQKEAPPSPWVLPFTLPVQTPLDPFFAFEVNGNKRGSGDVAIDVTGDGRVDLLQSTLFINPLGEPEITVLDDPNPGDQHLPLINTWATAPFYQSTEAGWIAGSPGQIIFDFSTHPGVREASLASYAFDQSGSSIMLGGMSRFADLDGDGLADWIVRGTRTVESGAGAACLGGAPSATQGPVGTIATSYVLRNRGNLDFGFTSSSLLPPGSITIPGSPGGQNGACAAAPFYQTEDWQVCDPAVGASCTDLLFHNRTYVQREFGGAFVVKRHLELGNEPVDLNSDGLADVLSSYELQGNPVRAAHLNDGARGFLRDDAWAVDFELYTLTGSDEHSTDKGARFGDVNGDGRVDLVVARANSGGGNTFVTYLNDGDVLQSGDSGAWREVAAWDLPIPFQTANGQDRGVRLLDVDGDGMVDVVEGRGNTRKVYLNNGSIPDLLTGVENPLGGTTEIEYRPSTAFDNTGADDIPDLPQVIPLVSRITVDDGNGVESSTDTFYQDGKYDADDREFRGFGRVATLNTGVDSRVRMTAFLQDAENAGLVASRQVLTFPLPSQTVIDEVVFAYTTDPDGVPPYRVLPASMTQSMPYPRFSRTLFEHDELGNRTATVELGEVSGVDGPDLSTEDNRRLERVFIPNESLHLVNRVAIERLREGATEGSGAVMRETRFFYDGDTAGTSPPAAGNLTRRVDVLDGEQGPLVDPTTTYLYDEYGNVTRVSDPRSNAAEGGGPTDIDYDATFHAFPVAVVNPLGHRREFSYAPDPGCAGITPGAVSSYPEGSGLVRVERGQNELDSTAQPQPRWLRCYDAFGRLVYEEAPLHAARTRYVYQDDVSQGVSRQDLRLVSLTNEASTRSFVDGLGRVYRVEGDGPQGETIVSHTVYDGLGRVQRESLPYFLGETPSEYVYEYDLVDRPKKKSLNGTQFVELYSYDGGWVTSTDANGRRQRRLVDALGRVVQVQELSSEGTTTTTYAYDVRDLLVSVVDHGGNETNIAYDALGRRRSLEDPDSGTTTFEYDANGNLRRRADANLDAVEWTYDALDRPLTQKINGAAGNDVAWTYDTATRGVGLLRSRTDRAGTYRVGAYDFVGRTQTERYDAGGSYHDFSTTYTKSGEISSRQYPGSPRRTVTWDRDARGFLVGLRSGTDSYASGITWDAQGRLTNWSAENGVETELSFSDTHLEELRVAGTTTLEHLEYRYDAGDRVEGVDDLRAPSLDRTYHYDDRDRLLRAEGPFGIGQAFANLYYAYDALGNLVCKDAANAVGVGGATACTTAGGKALVYPMAGPTAVRPHAPTAVSGAAAGYDLAGNLRTLGAREYEYNDLGQLARVRQGGATQAEFVYDGTGRLAVSQGGASPQRFLLAPDFEWNKTGSLARIHIQLGGLTIATHQEPYTAPTGGGCASFSPAGAWDEGPATLVALLSQLLATYLAWCLLWLVWRRPEGTRARAAVALAVGVTVFVVNSVPTPLAPAGVRPARASFPGTVTYYHADVLGSSLITTGQTGAVLQRASYTPYGEAAAGSSPIPEFGFTGQRFVSSVGIYDYGARFYDPALGRFLQPDSLVPEPFDPQSLNRYSYVRNSPTNRIDPTGNFDLWGGITSFFGSFPSFFGGTFPGFFTSVPSFLGSRILSPFYASLIAPIASIPDDIAEIWSPAWGAEARQFADVGGGSAKPAETIDRIQATLGVLGVVPGVGIGPDVANAVISAVRGNWGDAGLSVAAAVPVVGDLAGAGRLAVKYGDNAIEAGTSAATRAREIHSVLSPRTQRGVTTAVTETREGVRIVTSSEGRLRPAQRAALQAGEVAGVGRRGVHAEINGLDAANGARLTPTGVAPSRPACAECALMLEKLGIPLLGP